MDQLGSYRLRKRLAVGGMGEVYLGEKIGPEGFVKPVVLKCVLPQLASDRAFVQLFLDEARLAALLNHPNIAQVYDFGLVDDTYYIAMEYVPGYTVDDIRRKLRSIGQLMPLQHIACIASQVCQGLHYAHTLTDANGLSLGLVHRDVSPHNLIVSIDGSVKIVDFGIAKARAGLTRVQAKGAVGKFGYMSPEQARGEPVDGRSDLFSLGICLWELTTNERLHDPNLDRAPDYSPTRPIRSVETLRAELPRQFQQIIETALSIPPEDRAPTAQAMHLSLERFQAAMTHYAGQSALAAYIKDLVEGRIENPEESSTGSVVQPAPKKGASPSRTRSGPAVENMDAAQKYEEVFGVTMENKRPRPTLRAVPKSWEMREPPPATPTQGSQTPSKGPRLMDLKGAGGATGDIPSLAEPLGGTPHRARPTHSSPIPSVKAPSSKVPFVFMLMVAVLAGLGYAGWHFRDRIVPLAKELGGGSEPVPSTLSSVYRFESEPPGATVYFDAREEGMTPLESELIPDVKYKVTMRLAKYATQETEVVASVGTELRTVTMRLEPAATVRISSVPPGASISVDGRVVDDKVTPMVLDDFPSGRDVSVRAEIKGMPAAAQSVNVPAGGTKRLKFDLGS